MLSNVIKNIGLCQIPRKCLGMRVINVVYFHVSKSYLRPKTHYETLNLSRSCTTKEIKDAFITLSKKYHPDKNKGDAIAQEQFVKVNEAYNVLVKPQSRRDYDMTLQPFANYGQHYKPDREDFYEAGRMYKDPWKDPSFARNRDFSKEDKDNYYGVKGVKRQTNERILFWLLLFITGIMVFQLSFIRLSGVRNIRQMDRKSEENRQYLISVQERADMLGTRERQIEDAKRRLNLSSQE